MEDRLNLHVKNFCNIDSICFEISLLVRTLRDLCYVLDYGLWCDPCLGDFCSLLEDCCVEFYTIGQVVYVFDFPPTKVVQGTRCARW